jgi:hypothetical protein
MRRLRSACCTQAQLVSPAFQRWAALFGVAGIMHRKYWEWCFIAEALRRHGVLIPSKRGLGFAVGAEPLVACFAAQGAEILATDLEPSEAAQSGWVDGVNHASGKRGLNSRNICSSAEFDRLVSFQFCDMRAIPSAYRDFDFLWSSCALEHLGSLAAGTEFVLQSLGCLGGGGVAVHTTEFNVSSDADTIDDGPVVLYRRRDIDELIRELRDRGNSVEIEWTLGGDPLDYYVDIPPYRQDPHLKLRIGNYTATSIALIIVKPRDPPSIRSITRQGAAALAWPIRRPRKRISSV